MVLILQFGRLDLLKLLRQRRHDGTDRPTGLGEQSTRIGREEKRSRKETTLKKSCGGLDAEEFFSG